MHLKAILFDLDGTLLPMDQDVFIKGYFELLAKKAAPLGYGPKELYKAIWAGIAAMQKNDGTQTNEALFWQSFAAATGRDAVLHKPVFDEFYRDDFPTVQAFCGFAPEPRELIDHLKSKGMRLILATNPLFPQTATYHRIRWAGLMPDDFELVTTYENSRFCKPDPRYYREILEKQGLEPAECVMVGNDALEDTAAEALGMPVFLLTRDLINHENRDLEKYPKGGYAELNAWLDQMIERA